MPAFKSNIYLNESLISQYRAEYAESSCIFLPGFLKKSALYPLVKKLGDTNFETKYETEGEGKFGKVLFVPQGNASIIIFNLLLNDNDLFTALQRITDCKPIDNFVGRIHRSEGGEQHNIGWHGDNSDNRLLAITLCLGDDRYTGGKFEIRKKGSDNLLRQFEQLEGGDALIFKISPDLEHRLTTIETGRRTVGVGWFRGKQVLNSSNNHDKINNNKSRFIVNTAN